MSTADIIQIVLAAFSLIATVVVSLVLYWLERRHENVLHKIEEKRRQHELEEQATRFMMDNSEELDYLPWCVAAANISRVKRHIRPIYTNFCRLPSELRDEILKQAGLTIRSDTLPNWDWLEPCLEEFRKDVQTYNLGRDVLYDGAKYFRRSLNYYDRPYCIGAERLFDAIFPASCIDAVFHSDGKINLTRYVDDYFELQLNKKCGITNITITPPIDAVWESYELGTSPEHLVCACVMALVHEIALNLEQRVYHDGIPEEEDMTDAQVEFFEDMYYQTILELYYTYRPCKEVPDNENDISAEETFQSEGSRIQSKNEYSWRKKSFSSQKIKRKKAVISVGRIYVAFSSRHL